MTTRAPPPGAPSARVRPPWSDTSSRTTDSPMPLPPVADSASRLSRTYGSQTRTRSSCGIPGPSSSTQIRARSPTISEPTVIVCPAGPYFTALSSRLSRIWRSASRSNDTIALAPSAATTRHLARARERREQLERVPNLVIELAGAGEMRFVPFSPREKLSTFSTRYVSRRASWSMIPAERPRSSSRAQLAEVQQLGEPADLRERRAQLVRHAGHELRAQARELLLAAELHAARR